MRTASQDEYRLQSGGMQCTASTPDGHYLGQVWGHVNGYTALPLRGDGECKTDFKSWGEAVGYLLDLWESKHDPRNRKQAAE